LARFVVVLSIVLVL